MNRELAGLFLGLTGMALLIGFANWQVAVGVFCMIWGNNLERRK